MKYSKAVEIMMQLKAEYFYAFKDMPDELFKIKVKNFMNSLEGYTDKEIDVALGFVLKENKTLPTTAHFIEVLERNRDLFLPSPEELWSATLKVVKRMKVLSENFCPTYDDVEKLWEEQKKLYSTLPQEVKDFYVDYSNFKELINCKNLDVKNSQFMKGILESVKNKRLKQQLLKEENKKEENENDD